MSPPKYGKVRTTGVCVDDQATYRCAYGFQISHKETRTCMEDGTWSGSAPVCDRKYNRYGYGHKNYNGHGH